MVSDIINSVYAIALVAFLFFGLPKIIRNIRDDFSKIE